MNPPKCECRFANDYSNEVFVCDACSKLPCHDPEAVLSEVVRSKGTWLVEAWMENGEAKCSIFKGSKTGTENITTWTGVPEEQLIFVPAKVLAANVALMEKARSQGEA